MCTQHRDRKHRKDCETALLARKGFIKSQPLLSVSNYKKLKRSDLVEEGLGLKSWGQGEVKKQLNLWNSNCSKDVVKREKKREKCKFCKDLPFPN